MRENTITRKSWKVVELARRNGEAYFLIADSHGNYKLAQPAPASDPWMWWRTQAAAETFLAEHIR